MRAERLKGIAMTTLSSRYVPISIGAAVIQLILAVQVAAAQCGDFPLSSAASTPAFTVAPTKTNNFRLRAATGDYLAGRAQGVHAGVDIVATGISADKQQFAVYASGGGKIAF